MHRRLQSEQLRGAFRYELAALTSGGPAVWIAGFFVTVCVLLSWLQLDPFGGDPTSNALLFAQSHASIVIDFGSPLLAIVVADIVLREHGRQDFDFLANSVGDVGAFLKAKYAVVLVCAVVLWSTTVAITYLVGIVRLGYRGLSIESLWLRIPSLGYCVAAASLAFVLAVFFRSYKSAILTELGVFFVALPLAETLWTGTLGRVLAFTRAQLETSPSGSRFGLGLVAATALFIIVTLGCVILRASQLTPRTAIT